jgi:serine/threonine-protein kinase
MLLEAGQVVDGKYRIIRLIGMGGMGAVYEGENARIRRRVAIKVLNADSAANEENIRRFEREAQAAGEIGNEHILEVLDIGSLPNGDRYMVMEFLDGETLAARIERLGFLSAHQTAPIALQFLSALASAHAAGIIHRDLKPENIFVLRSKAGRADFVKLIDFGISKFSRPFAEGEIKLTRADAVLGTPCYMSPEQARGALETDERSDIYSCGVILYEAVTGRLPFEARTFNELMFKIALEDAPSPLALMPTLDGEFAAMISRALSRNPAGRFTTAREFAEAVEAWMRRNALPESLNALGSVSSPNVGVAQMATNPNLGPSKNLPTMVAADQETDLGLQKTGTAGTWARSASPHASRTRVLTAAGAIAVLCVAALAVVLFLRTSGSHPADATDHAAAVGASSAPATSSSSALAAPSTAPSTGLAPQEALTASTPDTNAAANAAGTSTRAAHGQPGGPGGGTKPASAAHSSATTAKGDASKPKAGKPSGGFELGY